MSGSCLKSSIKFGSYITLIGALLSFAFGFYLLWLTNDVNKQALFIDQAQVFKHLLEYGIFVFGAFLLILSIFGLYGAKRKSSCCLFIFQILTFVLALTGFALGIASNVMGKTLLNGDCQSIEWSKYMYAVSSQAEYSFCLPDQNLTEVNITGCQCAFNVSKFDVNQTLYEKYNNTGNENVTNYLLCGQQVQNEFLAPAAFLTAAEQIWDCAGWCNYSPIYLFSDVNAGIPDGDCYPQVKEFFIEKGNLLSYAFFAVGGFLVILTLMAICLCCSSEKRGSNRSYYNRMRVYDD